MTRLPQRQARMSSGGAPEHVAECLVRVSTEAKGAPHKVHGYSNVVFGIVRGSCERDISAGGSVQNEMTRTTQLEC
jgi:hypothetical protein